MARYWVITPYNSIRPDIWERAWRYDLANNTIAIGWTEVGDVSTYSKDRLRSVVEAKYPDANKASKTMSTKMMWQFYHEISEGDIIVARRGRKQIAAIGIVTQTAYYDWEKGSERVGEGADDVYPNFLGVQWHDQPRELGFDSMVFAIHTVYKIQKDKYDELVKPIPDQNGADTDGQIGFPLEKYLEDFIVSNFERIFGGNLILYRDGEGNIGQQYSTEVGDIDILAEEPSSNSFVVIELKKGRESDKVVGQILRYMGWVEENLCSSDQQVKGIIICKEADAKLNYALKMTDSIELKRYIVDFRLT